MEKEKREKKGKTGKDCYVDDGIIRFTDVQVVMAEIPDEITLAINLDNCWFHCPGCHSKFLWKHEGTELTPEKLILLIDKNDGITCVCFMGEGTKHTDRLNKLAETIKDNYPDMKTGLYTGRKEFPPYLDATLFDFIKIGPYIKEKGPLNKKTTNQKMYEITTFHDENGFRLQERKDITDKFWKNDNEN